MSKMSLHEIKVARGATTRCKDLECPKVHKRNSKEISAEKANVEGEIKTMRRKDTYGVSFALLKMGLDGAQKSTACKTQINGSRPQPNDDDDY